MEQGNKKHEDARNGRAQYSKGGEEGVGLEFRMSGYFFDTRQCCQETLSADLDPLISQLIELTFGRAAARSWRGESQRRKRYQSGDLHILKMNGVFRIDTPAVCEERVGEDHPT